MRVLQWRRPRLTSVSLCRTWKVSCLLVVLIVLAVVPVRNFFLNKLVAALWLPHSTWFLIQMIWDYQKFPVDTTPLLSSPVSISHDLRNIGSVFLKKVPRFEEYDQYLAKLQLAVKTGQTEAREAAQREMDQLLLFKPNMSPRERAIALYTMDVFLKACQAANLTYFLIDGSLMGQHRHHGMIPWDDDFDVMMNGSEWQKIRAVLSNVAGFELFAPSTAQWKFYIKTLSKGEKPFAWPNMDIFFYQEKKDIIYSLTWGSKNSVCTPTSDIFPLVKRKFDFWDVYVPRRSFKLLTDKFGDFHSTCVTSSYIHKTEDIGDKTVRRLPCEKLHKYFPFVFQSRIAGSDKVVEKKVVDGRQLSNTTIIIE